MLTDKNINDKIITNCRPSVARIHYTGLQSTIYHCFKTLANISFHYIIKFHKTHFP